MVLNGIGASGGRRSSAERDNADDQVAPADEQVFQSTVRPFLAKHCVACHNATAHTADLNLQAYPAASAVTAAGDTWRRVLARLKAGEMPPAAMPRPEAADVAAVTAWIERVLPASAAATSRGVPASGPGRVTMRRLNRSSP